MSKRNSKSSIFLAIMLVLLVSIACTFITPNPDLKVGPLRTESRSIEQGTAESVQVEIAIGAGELDVNGGGADLLQADFTYNVVELKPEVTFNDGVLAILTPETEGMASFWEVDDYRNEWDLRLNNDAPMEMQVFLGAGRANLNLGDLTLTSLDVDAGAGEVKLDLNSSAALTRLGVSAGVGAVTLDLTGDWQADLDASIEAGVGELTLQLPSAACVRVAVEGGISDTNTTGLTKDGSNYVNAGCAQSDVTLRIDISAGIGSIYLNVGD